MENFYIFDILLLAYSNRVGKWIMKNDVFQIDDYLNEKTLNENNLNLKEQLDKI